MSVVVAGGYPKVLFSTTERRPRDWCLSYLDAIVACDVKDSHRGQGRRMACILLFESASRTGDFRAPAIRTGKRLEPEINSSLNFITGFRFYTHPCAR